MTRLISMRQLATLAHIPETNLRRHQLPLRVLEHPVTALVALRCWEAGHGETINIYDSLLDAEARLTDQSWLVSKAEQHLIVDRSARVGPHITGAATTVVASPVGQWARDLHTSQVRCLDVLCGCRCHAAQ